MRCLIPENRKRLPRLNFTMFTRSTSTLLFLLLLSLDSHAREPQKSPPSRSISENKVVRSRDLGILLEGIPGKINAISDVAVVVVGYTMLTCREVKLVLSLGLFQTGVTVRVLP